MIYTFIMNLLQKTKVTAKGYAPAIPVVFLTMLFATEPAFAGLDQATTAIENIKTWAYGALGVGIFLYLMYHVVMALMNKGTWADVVMAVAYSAAAGAVIVVGEWAWSIWGN